MSFITVIMVFRCLTVCFLPLPFLLYSDLCLGLNMPVSNFSKSSLNALNNILKIVKKIHRFSELTSSAEML